MVETMTVESYAREWIRRERLRLRPRSVESYEYVLARHVLPTLGPLRLGDVTRDAVRSLVLASRDAGFAATTVALWLSIFRAMLNAAVDDELLSVNPCVRIGRLLPRRKGPTTSRALTGDEFARFLAALGHHPLRPLCLVAIRTGMRLGELLALRWDDVDLVRGTVTVRHSLDAQRRLGPPKGSKVWTLPLSPDAQEALRLVPRSPESRAEAFVFTDGHGVPWARSTLRRILLVTCEKAGIPPIWPHLLRHSFITALVESGATAWEVQQLARHSNVATSAQYVHVTAGERHVALVAGLDRRGV